MTKSAQSESRLPLDTVGRTFGPPSRLSLSDARSSRMPASRSPSNCSVPGAARLVVHGHGDELLRVRGGRAASLKAWITKLMDDLSSGLLDASRLMDMDDEIVYSAWMEASVLPDEISGDQELTDLLGRLECWPAASFLFGLGRCYLDQGLEQRRAFEAKLGRVVPKDAGAFLAWARLGDEPNRAHVGASTVADEGAPREIAPRRADYIRGLPGGAAARNQGRSL